jgi:hypothetical protein
MNNDEGLEHLFLGKFYVHSTLIISLPSMRSEAGVVDMKRWIIDKYHNDNQNAAGVDS